MKSKEVLIVIDMQNDFIDGALGSNEAKNIVSNVAKKIIDYKNEGKEVYFTRDNHFDNYLETHEGKYLPIKHCIEGTEGYEISKELNVGNSIVIDKNGFGFIGWKDILGDVDRIEVCGLCTEICVITNVLILRAIYPEVDIVVDKNACAGVTIEAHNAAIEVMKSCHTIIV